MYEDLNTLNGNNVARVLRGLGESHLNGEGIIHIHRDNGLYYYVTEREPVQTVSRRQVNRLTVYEIAKTLAFEFNLDIEKVSEVVKQVGIFNDKSGRSAPGYSPSCYVCIGYDSYKVSPKELSESLKML